MGRKREDKLRANTFPVKVGLCSCKALSAFNSQDSGWIKPLIDCCRIELAENIMARYR